MLKRFLIALAVLALSYGAGHSITFIPGVNGSATTGLKGTSTTGVGCGTSCGGLIINFIADAGASCTGIPGSDDGPALTQSSVLMRAFQIAHPGLPVTLLIPPGSICLLASCPVGSDGGKPFSGINSLTIIATGASLTTVSDAGNCGIYRGSVMNPWTADIFLPNNIGDTCVTMKVPGAEANYPVGRWVLLGGEGVQVNSFPPNYVVFEYQQVASNTGGQLCFTAPLANFYPNDARAGIDLSGQNCSNNYCGGPGGVTLMIPEWGSYFRTVGGTWDFHKNSGSVHWSARTVIFDNVTWLGDPVNNEPNACWFPTFVGTVTFNNTVFNRCNMEVDKEIDQMIFNGGNVSQGGSLNIQSPSLHTIAVNSNATLALFGTAPLTTCNNSSLTMFMGTTFGSPPQTFSGVNCALFIRGAQAFNGMGGANAPLDGVHLIYNGGGVFTLPNADVCASLPQWVSIGGHMYMGEDTPLPVTQDADNYFTITGMSVPLSPPDGTHNPCTQTITVTTTLPLSGFPPPATGYGGFSWSADQARDMSCSGCTPLTPDTDRTAVDLNFPAAQHQPLFTYYNRTFTCANNVPNVPGSFDINIGADGSGGNVNQPKGNWTLLTFNVITADTNPSDAGGAAAGFWVGQLFNPTTGATGFLNSNFNNVNLLIAGTRTVSPTVITNQQTGDTLTTPGSTPWVGGSNGGLNSVFGITNGPAAQCPVLQIIFQTTRP